MENNAKKSLFDLLVTRDLEPKLLDTMGKPVMDPSEADMFSFDWKTENTNYGTVVVLIDQNNNMEVYYGDNIGRSMEGDDKSDWYEFLQQLKGFATRNLLTFNLNNINRLKYTMQGLAAIKEGLFEGYYGKKRISYSDQPKQTRLMIKHNRDLGEGEARYRAIESLFVETAEGERFKLPFRNLIGGRIMARHVAEGGTPYDAFGQHIVEIINEMSVLARFIRAAKNKKFAGETDSLVETAIRHYAELKAKAKRMVSHYGYRIEKEAYDPGEITDSNVATDAIRDLFIETSIDSRIEEALPVLAKLTQPPMKEVEEFESWVEEIDEGTWSLPDSNSEKEQLKKLFSKPLMVGPDGTNATEQLYDLLGDDELFDIIARIAHSDPDANLWDDPDAMARIEELAPWVDASMFGGDEEPPEQPPEDQDDLKSLKRNAGVTAQQPKEDLDTDGVMMTKQSNMSS